jgi:pimeloyl-ACP methyl ester carboxylesterase
VTGYFHWPFLANVSLATRMITAFGPAAFLTEMTSHWAGKNPAGLSSFKSDDSLKVYGEFFAQPHVLKASCEDYEHGATTDVEAQSADQEAGRKIVVPLFLLYSEQYIGSRYEFPDVWGEWVAEGVRVKSHALGGGIGHFGAEEAPKESARVVGEWLKGL